MSFPAAPRQPPGPAPPPRAPRNCASPRPAASGGRGSADPRPHLGRPLDLRHPSAHLPRACKNEQCAVAGPQGGAGLLCGEGVTTGLGGILSELCLSRLIRRTHLPPAQRQAALVLPGHPRLGLSAERHLVSSMFTDDRTGACVSTRRLSDDDSKRRHG